MKLMPATHCLSGQSLAEEGVWVLTKRSYPLVFWIGQISARSHGIAFPGTAGRYSSSVDL